MISQMEGNGADWNKSLGTCACSYVEGVGGKKKKEEGLDDAVDDGPNQIHPSQQVKRLF